MKRVSSLFRLRRSTGSQVEEVHFHSGPQGAPYPCYDAHCAMPALSPADVQA